MLSSRLFRFSFCLVLLNLITPGTVSAQTQQPSVTLSFDTGEEGQIGVVVQTGESGPSVANVGALITGRIVLPMDMESTSMDPLFDVDEFPDGPVRTTQVFAPIDVPPGQLFLAGAVLIFLPARLGAELTPEMFLETFLADFVLEVNGVKFMDSDLLNPEHVASAGPIPGAVVGAPTNVFIFALNVTMSIMTPGTYVIRSFNRIPKTVPLPEFDREILAGELILQETINIVPAGSVAIQRSPTNLVKVLGRSGLSIPGVLSVPAGH